MRIGNTAGGMTAGGSGRTDMFGTLLSVLVSLSLIVMLAPPAQAAAFEATVTAEASCGEGGGEIEFYVTNEDAELDMDLVSAVIYFGEEDSIVYDSDGPIASVGPGDESDSYFFEGLDDGQYELEVYVLWDLFEGDVDDFLNAEVTVDCEGGDDGIDCSEGGCESFEDPDGEWFATCDGCTGQVIIKDPGNNVAEIVVTGKTPFKLILTTTGKGPNPGKASVDIDNDLDGTFESTLARCGKMGAGDANCVQIQRAGGHTQYTVFYQDDPGFSFR